MAELFFYIPVSAPEGTTWSKSTKHIPCPKLVTTIEVRQYKRVATEVLWFVCIKVSWLGQTASTQHQPSCDVSPSFSECAHSFTIVHVNREG